MEPPETAIHGNLLFTMKFNQYEMFKLLICLVVLTFAFASAIDPPTWPSQFSSKIDIVDEEAHEHHRVSVGSWNFDEKKKAERLTLHRDHITVEMFALYELGLGFEYIEDEGEWNCSSSKIGKTMPVPNFSQFKFVGERKYRGHDINEWEFDNQGTILRYLCRKDNEDPVRFVQKEQDGKAVKFIEFYDFIRGPQNEGLFNNTELFPHVQCSPQSDVSPVPKYTLTLPSSVCSKTATCAHHYGSCGCPYVWGGNSCACNGHGGFDCSGEHGYSGIARTASAQARQGTSCGSCRPGHLADCHKGDLFFYNFGGGAIEHVVMYIGDGKAAECPHTGLNCRIITPYSEAYVTCRRHC